MVDSKVPRQKTSARIAASSQGATKMFGLPIIGYFEQAGGSGACTIVVECNLVDRSIPLHNLVGEKKNSQYI